MKIFRNLCLVLSLSFFFSACSPTTEPTQKPTPTDNPTETPAPTENEKTENKETELQIDDTNIVETLGLCVTDGNFGEVAVGKAEMRFRDYVRVGIKTVRIETVWSSPAPGQWSLDSAYQKILQAAIRAGLRLKLILPTIMKPPARIFEDEGARLVAEDGTLSLQNTVSYWYAGLCDYTEDAIRCMLSELSRLELLDAVDGIIVDFGPAGEPLYPAMWTQNTSREMLWCYSDNAQADFRLKMQEKYVTIEKANTAWETGYASFDSIQLPKPGTASGVLWEDVLLWYRDTKRTFIDSQTAVFRKAVDTYSDGRIQLILYMPGEAYTQTDWQTAIETGTATGGICICSENEFIVQTARKYGALLQFTGLPGTTSVKKVLAWMSDNGYEDIPVYGENYADTDSASDPVGLGKICRELGLSGIDYTFTSYLYDETGYRKNAVFTRFTEAMPYFAEAIITRRSTAVSAAIRRQEAVPEGDVLALSLRSVKSDATANVRLSFSPYTICAGDLLEYDVFVPVGVSGVGTMDGTVSGRLSFSANPFVSFRNGLPVGTETAEELFASGEWVHCQLTIGIDYDPFDTRGNYVGAQLTALTLLNAPIAAEDCIILFDNIVITNAGKVQYTIFSVQKEYDNLKSAVVASQCDASLEVQPLS